MTKITFASSLILLQNYINAVIRVLEEELDPHLLYLVSERKWKQICIYFKRIIRKPSDAIPCALFMTDALSFVVSGGITKNIMLSKSAPSGCAAMRSTSFLSRHRRQGNALLKHNTTWKSV